MWFVQKRRLASLDNWIAGYLNSISNGVHIPMVKNTMYQSQLPRQIIPQPKQEVGIESDGNLSMHNDNKEEQCPTSCDKMRHNIRRTVPQVKQGTVKERNRPAQKEDQAIILP